MTVSLSPVGGAASQFFNSGGVPLYGGKIYTYEAGTTTPKATYTEANGLTAHPNPIILDSAGRVPSGEIWLTSAQAYLFILKTSSEELIGTYDNLYGIAAGAENAVTETQVATAGQTSFVLTSMTYTPGVFTLGVYIDGVNQVVNNSYVETSATTVTFVSGLHVGAVVKFVNINSAATSSDLVTYLPAGAGATTTTVQDTLRKRFVIADDFISTSNTAAQNVTGWAALVTYVNTLTEGAHVQASRGTYLFNASIQMPKYTILAGEGKLSTTFSFSNTGDSIQSTVAINSSIGVYTAVRDIGIVCTNGASTGAGYADIGGSFVELENVLFSGHKYGTIFDQTEVATITKCHYTMAYAGSSGIWLVNGADHTLGALPGFTNRITISENHFNAVPTATANILDDGGGCHTIRDNNFNAGDLGIRAAGVSGLTIQGNESEVHIEADIYLCDTTSTGAYVGPCYGFDISSNILISGSGGKNVKILNAVNGKITTNVFGQTATAINFSGGAANAATGIIIEGNGKLITGTARTSGAFIGGFSRILRQNIIRQTAVTYIAGASGAGTVTLTPANMEFIYPGTRMRLVNEDGTNGEDCIVTFTTATTFTTTLASAKAANFLFYGSTPANEEEGSWTPTLGAATVNGVHTYSTQIGRWSRRGNQVFITGSITISAKDAAISGNLAIKGLPFVPENVTGMGTTANVSIFGGLTFGAGYTQLSGNIPPNTPEIQLIISGSGQVLNAPNASSIPGATCSLLFSAEYLTSSVV